MSAMTVKPNFISVSPSGVSPRPTIDRTAAQPTGDRHGSARSRSRSRWTRSRSINIDADSTFALMLEAQRRGHALWHYEVRHMALREGVKRQGERREERLQARVRPVTVERKRGAHYAFGEAVPARPRHDGRGADAPGSAVRHGLHHRHPPARAHPSEDAGGERPRRGAQRAGEAAGHALPRSDAADHDHLGPRGDPFIPRSNTRTSSSSRCSATAAPACSASSRTTRTWPRCWRCTSPARASR